MLSPPPHKNRYTYIYLTSFRLVFSQSLVFLFFHSTVFVTFSSTRTCIFSFTVFRAGFRWGWRQAVVSSTWILMRIAWSSTPHSALSRPGQLLPSCPSTAALFVASIRRPGVEISIVTSGTATALVGRGVRRRQLGRGSVDRPNS